MSSFRFLSVLVSFLLPLTLPFLSLSPPLSSSPSSSLPLPFPFVAADTPANCSYPEVVGTWSLALSAGGHTNTIDCTSPYNSFHPAISSIQITLSYPNIATLYSSNSSSSSSAPITGTFTLIYNQGFEVRLGGYVYFAFFLWFTDAKGKTTSYCDQTTVGWFHRLDDNTDWGCWSGFKQDPFIQYSEQPPIRKHLPADHQAVSALPTLISPSTLRRSSLYRHNPDFIAAINSRQSLWTATRYVEHEGMTLGEMESRGGGATDVDAVEMAKQWSEYVQTQNKLIGASTARPSRRSVLPASAIPKSFDLRNVSGVNYVSPVRDQGHCGSCYAFATLGMLESRVRFASNNTQQPTFSPQQVLSCGIYSQGCHGGFNFLVSKWANDFGVIDEACFPYMGKDNNNGVSCAQQCAKPAYRYRVTSNYEYIGGYYGASTVEAMQTEMMTHGAIAVSFMVYPDFRAYSGGVYTHQFTANLKDPFNPFVLTNHAVLAVGWGETDAGVKYWMVKNSWGEKWGQKGYFRILRGGNGWGGECGIESLPVAAEVVLQ